MNNKHYTSGRADLRRRRLLLAAAALAGMPVARGVRAQAKPAAGTQADLEALIKAARAEGELTFYSAAVAPVARRVAGAFTAKYGVKAQFVRLSSQPLQQRYAAEAEAGTFAADLVLNAGNAVAFAEDGIKKGWVDSITSANLPVVKSGEFPAAMNRGVTAVIQVAPQHFVYNTEKVKGADIPRNWPDLLNPKFKGQILIFDPRASDATLAQWVQVLNKFGESYLRQLNAQVARRFESGNPTVQALAAGEGMIMMPVTRPSADDLSAKGAPIAVVVPATVTGVEIQVMLTARAKSKRPNAARLMANYIMSPEGNKVFNADPGGFPIYDLSGLPKDYEPPTSEVGSHRQRILSLLGFGS